MNTLKDLSMADLLAIGNYADENRKFAESMKDDVEEDIYDNMSNTVYLEIEARIKILFPRIKGL